MAVEPINLALRILDDQLVDVDGRRFGRIDDIELDGRPGVETQVGALIVGAGAWRWRVPVRLAGVTAALTPQIVRRIPWPLVRSIEPGVVRIATTMGELGFGTGHPAGARWVVELDAGTLRLSSLLGARVQGPDGEPLGRVHDVRAQLDGSPESPGVVRVRGILVGRDGWKQRLIGSAGGRRGHPSPEAGLVDWEALEQTEGDGGAALVCRSRTFETSA